MIKNKTFNAKIFSLSAACEQATKETLACVHWMGRQIQTLFQNVTQFFPFLGKIHQIAQRAFFSKEDNKTAEILSEPLSISNETPVLIEEKAAQNKTQRTWINFCAGMTENIGFMTGALSGSAVLASLILLKFKLFDPISEASFPVFYNSLIISSAATSIGLISSFFSEAKKEKNSGQTSLPILIAKTAALSIETIGLYYYCYGNYFADLSPTMTTTLFILPSVTSIASLWLKFASKKNI